MFEPLRPRTNAVISVGIRTVAAWSLNVSGGQKQRLCIARALLKHPKIIIFDDSTSAVDTATEARIRDGLAKLSNLTKIIIAQRITSIMHADRIYIIDDGRVVESGTHDELLANSAIYQDLYESQMKGGEEDATRSNRIRQTA